MNSAPRISVVIPTYNRASLVGKAIDSVLVQTYPAAEIIVVDDGSKDDTRGALAAYGDRIRAIHQVNAGLAGARNTGIEHATSDWVAFLDDDDEYVPQRLERAVEAIRAHPDIQVHTTNTALVSADGSEIDLMKARSRQVNGLMRLERPLTWVLGGCFFAQTLVARRELLNSVGRFRKTFYEDMDIFYRLSARGPWTLDSRCSLRLMRRPGEDLNLSSLWRSKPVENYSTLVRIHRDVLKEHPLEGSEPMVVLGGLGSNLHLLGCTYFEKGNFKEGKACFKEASRVSPKLQSRIKAWLPAVLGPVGLKLVRLLQPKRDQLLRSSQSTGSK
jgi:glycosyltransferase involved in cell wall biosynthesis